MNEKWAKAHLRLASAYIALGGHSNDACQSLQNAIRLDPSNPTAKQMLMKELRRDQIHSNDVNGRGDENDNNIDEGKTMEGENGTNEGPTYVNENDYTNNETRPSAPPMNDSNNNNNNNNNNNANSNTYDIDDSPTFLQRIRNYWSQLHYWYQNDASDNWKSFIHVICFILVLYIAFGGRFGLESSFSNHKSDSGWRYSSSYGQHGDYGKGNAYEQFYNNRDNYHRRRETTSTNSGSGTYSSSNSYPKNSRDTNGNYDSAYGYNNNDRYSNSRSYDSHGYTSRGRNNNGYNSSSDWDAIVPYLLVGGIALGLNRFLGVPIHVMPMGFGMRRGFGFGGGGIGFGGGFGPRVRFGRGGMRFGFGPAVGGMGYGGGFPMGGGGVGGRARYGRRRWY